MLNSKINASAQLECVTSATTGQLSCKQSVQLDCKLSAGLQQSWWPASRHWLQPVSPPTCSWNCQLTRKLSAGVYYVSQSSCINSVAQLHVARVGPVSSSAVPLCWWWLWVFQKLEQGQFVGANLSISRLIPQQHHPGSSSQGVIWVQGILVSEHLDILSITAAVLSQLL